MEKFHAIVLIVRFCHDSYISRQTVCIIIRCTSWEQSKGTNDVFRSVLKGWRQHWREETLRANLLENFSFQERRFEILEITRKNPYFSIFVKFPSNFVEWKNYSRNWIISMVRYIFYCSKRDKNAFFLLFFFNNHGILCCFKELFFFFLIITLNNFHRVCKRA